jgi:pimeloyl-ACP methyl ester carboxylesterase
LRCGAEGLSTGRLDNRRKAVMEPLDIFIGGGGDDLMPGGGVLRTYAREYAAETGREVRYIPNARVGRAMRLMRTALGGGRSVRVVGHSWGAPDAYRAVAALVAEGLSVDLLVTLDPVGGPFRRPRGVVAPTYWLNVVTVPPHPDRSDRLAHLPPFSRRGARLPQSAQQLVMLPLHHWDVERMMSQSGARALLDGVPRDG